MSSECYACDTQLLPDEIITCDPCRMSLVIDKLFTDIIKESF